MRWKSLVVAPILCGVSASLLVNAPSYSDEGRAVIGVVVAALVAIIWHLRLES